MNLPSREDDTDPAHDGDVDDWRAQRRLAW